MLLAKQDTTRAFSEAVKKEETQKDTDEAAEPELQDDSTELKKWDELFNSKRSDTKRRAK